MMFKPREFLLSEIEKTDKILQELGGEARQYQFSAAFWSAMCIFVLFAIPNAEKNDNVGCEFPRL
jgi:hypothetical protein